MARNVECERMLLVIEVVPGAKGPIVFRVWKRFRRLYWLLVDEAVPRRIYDSRYVLDVCCPEKPASSA